MAEQGGLHQAALHIVLSGSVSMFRGEHMLRAVGAGGSFGEASLIRGSAPSARVVATRATVTVCLQRQALRALLHSFVSGLAGAAAASAVPAAPAPAAAAGPAVPRPLQLLRQSSAASSSSRRASFIQVRHSDCTTTH